MNFLIPDDMPDKNLTDTEITIKALKEVLELMLCEGDLQRTSTISHAIDLINRLQAENEKWQGGYMTQKQEIANLEIELKAMRGAANSYKAENERLKEVNDSFTDIGKLYSEIKAEAQKEFADRLKLRFSGTLSCSGGVIARAVDNLLKELVGE